MRQNVLSGFFSYQVNNNNKYLIISFVDINKFLNLFEPTISIIFKHIKINKGIGKNYKYFDASKFSNVTYLKDFLEKLHEIGTDNIDFFYVDFYLSNNFYITISENSIWLYFLNQQDDEIKNIILKIFIEIEKLNFDNAYHLYTEMIVNQNKLIKVDNSFNILGIYNSMNEYRNSKNG